MMATQTAQSMISETRICNQALSWLGHSRITTIDQVGSKTAEICRENYPFIRDTLLESRMWTFATVRETSTSAETSAFGGLYVHPMPIGWLKVFRVYGSGRDRIDDEWRKEANGILSCYSAIDLWGVERATDSGKFTNLFAQALAARMAAELALPLAKSRQMQADMWTLYERKLADAAARDGQQGANEKVRSSSLVDARYRY